MDKETPATAPDSGRSAVVTYAALAGLTPLIPVPVVDDLAKNYFRRRLVLTLAAAHGLTLSRDAVESLTAERGAGCLGGCLAQVLLYPAKKIFRKVFYFLEWKRAVDLASHTYHYGYLVDYAFREGLAGGRTDELGAAIDKVCREAPIKPVERAVGAAFRQSKAALLSAAGVMERSLGRIRGRPDEGKVAAAVAPAEEAEKQEIAGLTDRLQQLLRGIPESHFSDLRARLDAQLARAPDGAKGAR